MLVAAILRVRQSHAAGIFRAGRGFRTVRGRENKSRGVRQDSAPNSGQGPGDPDAGFRAV